MTETSGAVASDTRPTNPTGGKVERSGSDSGGGGAKPETRFSAYYFMFSVIGGWAVEVAYSVAAEHDGWTRLRTFCLLWFASAAAFFGGSILGFLFAVPKSLSIPDGPTLQGANRYKTNTNLEEVSDWLTKIILGLGLVNVDKLIQFTDAVGEATAGAIGTAQGAKVISICAMIYGFVAAFIIVYSWTRIQLRRDFERSELPTLPRS